jgi:hypothetical protein
VWWTDLRGKGTRNSPNGALYDWRSRRQATGLVSCAALYQSSRTGRLGGEAAERAGTDAVLDGRLGSGRELGGAEMMEVKRGKLRCAPSIAAQGGGRWWRKLQEQWAGNDGSEAVGTGKAVATTVRRRSAWPRRLCSDEVTDRWAPRGFRYFQFIQNRLTFKNSKWVPYVTPKIPNFCMRLAWDIMNNFLNCANIQFPT